MDTFAHLPRLIVGNESIGARQRLQLAGGRRSVTHAGESRGVRHVFVDWRSTSHVSTRGAGGTNPT